MTMRRARFAIIVLLTGISLTACATSSSAPPTAMGDRAHPAWLTGTWNGESWETAAGTTQGRRNITLTFAPDGGWKSTVGGSGTSWLEGDSVVLEGITGEGTPIKYSFKHRQKSGEEELWGMAQARYGTAAVSLTKAR